MGVDAGGDAFRLAEMMNREAEVQKHVTQESVVVLRRASEQYERLQSRIAEQGKLLGVQGKRITHALAVLGDEETNVNRITDAEAILRGERDNV